MIRREDIFIVEVTDQMLVDAVTYAEKSLHYTYNRMGSSNLYDRVRNIVKGLIMESSFKRLLDFHKLSYDLLGNTHWTKKDRYDVGLDGHKYDIKGSFISETGKMNLVKEEPGWLLDCCALVPSDQINTKSLKDDDYYVFPFMIGDVEKNNGPDLFSTEMYRYLIHSFWDYSWTKNEEWSSKGQLTITSKMNRNLSIRIGGQGVGNELIVEEFDIAPRSKVTTRNEFFTVLFAQTNSYPEGEIIIHSTNLSKSERIGQNDWGNIWFYNSKVYFTGFMSKQEFKTRSIEIPRFYKDCKQYGETKTTNRKLFVHQLNPLCPILPNNAIKYIPAKR